MKSAIAFIAAFFAFVTNATAQDPVHWTFRAEKTADKTYEIHLTATIDEGWHIYAQHQPKDAISLPTKIVFTKSPLFTLNGTAKESGKLEKQRVEVLEIEQNMYEHTVDFVQVVKLKAAVKTTASGTITYMACTGEQCLQPKTIPFSAPLP